MIGPMACHVTLTSLLGEGMNSNERVRQSSSCHKVSELYWIFLWNYDLAGSAGLCCSLSNSERWCRNQQLTH